MSAETATAREEKSAVPLEMEPGATAAVVVDVENGAGGGKGNTAGGSSDAANGNGGAATGPVAYHQGESRPLLYKLWELVRVVLPAGCYAFGGPTAHLAVFHDLFVENLRWLNDQEFVDLLAMGMTLPGPTSTEFCIAVGTYRAGVPGAIVSFLAWSLPSFIVMLCAGLGATHMDPNKTPDWMAGLAPAATVLIFVAFFRLGKKIVGASRLKALIALASASVTLLIQSDPRMDPRSIMWILPVMLVVGGSLTLGQKHFLAWRQQRQRQQQAQAQQQAGPSQPQQEEEEPGAMGSAAVTSDTYDRVPVSKWSSLACFLAIAAFLFYLLAMDVRNKPLSKEMHVFASFFIVGITIYGGGQVMLPLLVSISVDPGWLSMDQFLAGFALVQMMPGPLSNLAAYIGAIYMGAKGAALGTVGFFLPGVLLVIAFLPIWDRLRKVPNIRPFLAGVNATGLGLILAVGIALYLKVVRDPADAVVTAVTACLVGYLNQSSIVGVLTGALVGFLLSPTCLNWGQTKYVK